MNEQEMPTPFMKLKPGYTIKKYLKDREWSYNNLSEKTGIPVEELVLIINSDNKITEKTARMLSLAFKTSSGFWINLDTNYRLNKYIDKE